jgi:autotransporter-associated beta strand protein
MLLIALITAVAGRGAVDNWTSTTSSSWSKTGNWSTGTPTASSVATFNTATGLKAIITFSAASAADSLVFSAAGGANAYTFDTATTANANTLTLTSGLTNSAAATQTFYNSFTLAGSQTWTAGSGALNFNGNVNLGSGAHSYALTLSGANAITIAGIVADGGTPAGSLTYAGSGTLTLSGANTYTGATTVNSGTLLFGASNVLSSSTALSIASGATVDLGWGHSATVGSLAGAGTLDIKGGPFAVGDTANTTFSGTIIDSGGYGSLVKQGSGTLTLSGANTFNGVTMINAGALSLQSNNALGGSTSGNTVASGAALQLQNNISVTEGSFAIAGSGIGSTGAIRNLSGNNTLNSALTLNASSTLGSDAGTLAVTGDINLGSSQTLTTTGAGTLNLSGALNGSSGLTQAGPGMLQLSGTTSNSYTGNTAINDGTLQLNKTAGTNALAGGTVSIGDGVGGANSASLTLLASNQIADYAGLITINSDGQLNLNNQSEKINTLAGTGAIAFGTTGYLGVGINSGSSTFGGSLTGTGVLEKLGSGTLTFNSSFNFGGELRITSGTVVLAGITATVGTLHITGNTILDFGNSSASTLNATTLIIDAGVTLTITNWVSATDYFYAQNFNGATFDTRGTTPENQITFTGYSNNATGWQSFDHQVTPAPEPATYGALFVALCLGAVALRRRQKAA